METRLEIPLVKDLKQIKVDNWGTFFLQKLLQLYINEELLDFHIKFQKSNQVVKVHRLVVTTCTDYFVELERQQSDINLIEDRSIIMPSDITYESVKSIISFMYTGQLEYWASEHNDLYRTAQKLKMSVLIKLLDAQSDQTKSTDGAKPDIDFEVDKKKMVFQERQSLNDAIFNDKSPILKRKLDDQQSLHIPKSNVDFWNSDSYTNLSTPSFKNYQGPSRFDLPEVDELTLGVFSSFDDITYNTQPIVQAPERMSCSNKILNTFLNVPAISEQSNESSFSKKPEMNSENSDDDWSQSYITKIREVQHIPKKLRFDSSNKENFKKLERLSNNADTSIEVIDNHAKIIREVLKKYPHLVQQSKNIRLKIMQKETKNTECSTPGRTKISYVVLKSDFLMSNNSNGLSSKNFNCNSLDNDEMGPWKCAKCNLDEKYTNYFMYRRHMQDVHNEKFDPRICEHCGYKATKRNILMYHMYTKHNITPPKNMSFPKCKICSYVGLSQSLLARHQANHKNQLVDLSPTLYLGLHTTKTLKSNKERKNHFDNDITYCEENINSENSMNIQNKCLECGKYFNNFSNLEFHLKSHQNELLGCESLNLKPTTSESTSLIRNDYKISGIKTETVETACQTITGHTGRSDNDAFVEYSEINRRIDNRILSNTSTYIHRTENCVSNDSFLSNENFVNNLNQFEEQDEIVTEVVEELQEPTEIEKDKLIYQISNKSSIDCKEKNSTDYIQSTSEHTKVNIDKVDNIIQYVEEETEILEYETNGSS